MTAKLNLIDFDPLENGQAEFNQMTRTLDGLIHGKLRDIGESDPIDLIPAPEAGEAFIVSGTGVGAWVGEDDNIAIAKETVLGNDQTTWNSASGWTFVTPIVGFILWLRDGENQKYTHDGGSWSLPFSLPDLAGGANSTNTRDKIVKMLGSMRDHGLISG